MGGRGKRIGQALGTGERGVSLAVALRGSPNGVQVGLTCPDVDFWIGRVTRVTLVGRVMYPACAEVLLGGFNFF